MVSFLTTGFVRNVPIYVPIYEEIGPALPPTRVGGVDQIEMMRNEVYGVSVPNEQIGPALPSDRRRPRRNQNEVSFSMLYGGANTQVDTCNWLYIKINVGHGAPSYWHHEICYLLITKHHGGI